MTRFKFKNQRKILWKMLSRHKISYTLHNFLICVHNKHKKLNELHGKITTLISLTIQIFKVRASFNHWFSENFHFRSNWWYINGQGNIIFVLFYLLNLILCYYYIYFTFYWNAHFYCSRWFSFYLVVSSYRNMYLNT